MAFKSPHRVLALTDVQKEAFHHLLIIATDPARCALSTGYKCLKFLLGKTFFTPELNGDHLIILYHMIDRVTTQQGVGRLPVAHFASLIRIVFCNYYSKKI